MSQPSGATFTDCARGTVRPGHPHVCTELGFPERVSLGLEARGLAELGTL